MKRVEMTLLIPVLPALLAVSCSKEKKALNRPEGRWKAVELKIEGYPPGPPEYEFYLTFDDCRPEETCTVVTEAHYGNGAVNTDQDSFRLLNDDRLVIGNDSCRIVRLTKTELSYVVPHPHETTQVTYVKQ